MSAAVPFFHSWPKGSSDVLFPLSIVLKGSVQRKIAQIYFQEGIKYQAVGSADGDHAILNLDGS